MSLYQSKDLAEKLDNLTTFSISNTVMPVITRSGISVGKFLINKENGQFCVKRNKFVVHKTYTKTAALIVAGLLNKKSRSDDIRNVLDADFVAFSMKNDLELYKYHYNAAIKDKNETKEGIMLARFERANDRYQIAKKTLQQSYSRLF